MEAKRELVLVKIDDTRHWSDEVRGLAEAVYTVYLVDLSTRTYCCEITPSYAMFYIAHDEIPRPQAEDESDDAYEERRERLNEIVAGEASEDSYMHCRALRAYMAKHPDRVRKVDDALDLDELDPDDSEDETTRKILDQIEEGWGTGALMY